jgi:hypothetical protein
MSEEFHKPTYTAPQGETHRAYNASQVRLYGVQGISFPGAAKKGDVPAMRVLTGASNEVVVSVIETEKPDKPLSDDTMIANLRKALGQSLNKAESSFIFLKTIMTRYMFYLSAVKMPEATRAELVKGQGGMQMPEGDLSSGIIFGYAYEGHCYDLPKPKIMLIPALPEPIPDDDSGYYSKRNKDYRVWIVDKLDVCIEIDINQGFVDQIVLEANLPGKRSPSMYAAKMTMAHRGGRLTE